ncbi:MAG: HPP family protein [Campylobacterales bacterium]|nr:HPP family protein [Campylobacterales bacterium]
MRKNKKTNIQKAKSALIVSLGAIIGLSFIGLLAQTTQSMMIIAPFGATAVLLFALPHSPSSTPLSVVSSYAIASAVGLVFLFYGAGDWLYIGIGFGITLFLLQIFEVVHPPAGAHYIVVTQGTLTLHALAPLIVGLSILVIIAIFFKRALSD